MNILKKLLRPVSPFELAILHINNLQRLERIRRNQEKMQQLGLQQMATSLVTTAAAASGPSGTLAPKAPRASRPPKEVRVVDSLFFVCIRSWGDSACATYSAMLSLGLNSVYVLMQRAPRGTTLPSRQSSRVRGQTDGSGAPAQLPNKEPGRE